MTLLLIGSLCAVALGVFLIWLGVREEDEEDWA